ncbi:hypothetical protein EJ110_NYTH12449 [Nymphaea thermarum]|nr:hypothetical protein EJ110_NYTH12449 [Nymphaea thermarum]
MAATLSSCCLEAAIPSPHLPLPNSSVPFQFGRLRLHHRTKPGDPLVGYTRNHHLFSLNPQPSHFHFFPPLSSSASDSDFSDPQAPENKTRTSSFDVLQLKRVNGFLDEEDLRKLRILENFLYVKELGHGLLQIRLMAAEEIDKTVELLADSFAELSWAQFTYYPLLKVVVSQHVMERRAVIPHAATLVGFYGTGNGEMELAGTVEISFDRRGANANPPTPTPPKGSPYLCNMSVRKELRRRGIGRHLLKASEELVPQLGASEIYLHCRLIDTAPLSMYSKAGYNVVRTDSILSLLSFQRRKHLMYKRLALPAKTRQLIDPL